ncbi:hypothetical protein [Bacillus sp. UNCCL81]|uniref:hypothetical protein n=1 Tax=Bacillus sp. UNCCL81 TaxID=1502755 RepID=UPI0004257F71|nr:hypothetical protein [Bacillus sp. UNCCL81]SFD60922.1 hypothetical protein SAMN02799633_04269 [Bacillus sp. UNCCL81]
MKFNYEKFVSEIYNEFKEFFTLKETEELLSSLNDFKKDTPISTGKKLLIQRVIVRGEKSKGEKIDLNLPFNSGVNIIIANNFKGKSSLFKIIQLALTGNNKLKNDVKKWLHSLALVFKINEKDFSIIITFNKSRKLKGLLYGEAINNLDDLNLEKLDPIIDANGIEDYEEQIQDFFFKQFSYYSLKWTQKSSSKDKNELIEANASWKTYFKSIYLESKDSDKLMYGSQGKKVLQMLLGLELTYAINQLSIKKDFLQFNNAQTKDIIGSEKDKKLDLLNRIRDIDQELTTLKLKEAEINPISPLYKEYNYIIDVINEKNSSLKKATLDLNKFYNQSSQLETTLTSYNTELKRITKETNKVIRSINDMKEYIDIGIFFSNLNIKQCPSCNRKVSNDIKSDHVEKECVLCHELVDDTDYELNRELYIQKINDLEVLKENLMEEQKIIKNNILIMKEEIDTVNKEIEKLEINKSEKSDLIELNTRLAEIELHLNELDSKKYDNENINILISEKAVLEYRLSELDASNEMVYKSAEIKIKLLEMAIKNLSKMRYKNSEKIIGYLNDLMLEELKHFGLHSITGIRINENFDIHYEQDGEYISFDGITEGEQLRAKLALYLGLIQLDIEYNFGRHTRFLIIDSPNKEEGDSNYLNGLKDVLKGINERYSNQLQIIIGTAERDLVSKFENEKVFNREEYVF